MAMSGETAFGSSGGHPNSRPERRAGKPMSFSRSARPIRNDLVR
jgi:hypothetical protein